MTKIGTRSKKEQESDNQEFEYVQIAVPKKKCNTANSNDYGNKLKRFFPDLPVPPPIKYEVEPPSDRATDFVKQNPSRTVLKRAKLDYSWIDQEHVDAYIELVRAGYPEQIASARTGIPMRWIDDHPNIRQLVRVAAEEHLTPFRELLINLIFDPPTETNPKIVANQVQLLKWYLSKKAPHEFQPEMMASLKLKHQANKEPKKLEISIADLEKIAGDIPVEDIKEIIGPVAFEEDDDFDEYVNKEDIK